MDSPVGGLLLFERDGRLCSLGWADREAELVTDLAQRFAGASVRPAADPGGFVSCLSGYFAGELRAIDAIPVDTGGTDFQRSVWSALREIPVGRTTSYAALAERIGRPRAVRAVGLANGKNPIPIVVPCHRVIGKGGSLTGYGGGLERKRLLLVHEGALLA
jgi:methylated-DNA-[protein]-cysteine S-methyltransferase